MHTTFDHLSPLNQQISARMGEIAAASTSPEGDSDGSAVLRRQHSLLADLKAAVEQGVTVLDFAYEGEFDPVEASTHPHGESAFEKARALHEIALAGIEPLIAAARAAGITTYAPELDLADQTPDDSQAPGERLA